jgi:SulP family sulfate permease
VFGLAVANTVAGCLGGIPATAALARTALNINSGANSRVSAIVNCIGVLLLGIFFLPYFKVCVGGRVACSRAYVLVWAAVRV